ncbi:hypothetical protein E4U52_005892 [Claviceps spartinae]|nr:hypothetical protein E4U52_005892 [Claviceps spartinae]
MVDHKSTSNDILSPVIEALSGPRVTDPAAMTELNNLAKENQTVTKNNSTVAVKGAKTNWHTPASLDISNKSHKQIHTVLASANFEYLEQIALRTRNARDESSASGVTCAIDSGSFTYGMNNLVLNVAFSDDIPLESYTRQHEVAMLSEIATMKTLKSRTTIPVPEVFAFDVSPSNKFGSPYVLLECLKGKTLQKTMAREVPADFKQHVASQLADVLYQLENLTFDRLGRICDGSLATPCVQTSLEWFYKYRQKQNRQALKEHADDPEWRAACWILKQATSHIIVEDRLYGPFPLCHFDLHYGNLLFDDEYNLTGVVDWDGAATAPLERLAVSPEFITFPGISDEKNQVILDFRATVRDCLQELVSESDPKTSAKKKKTTLSMILGSKQADITHRCTYSCPYRAIWDGQMVAKLIYGDHVSWEQLVAAYGENDDDAITIKQKGQGKKLALIVLLTSKMRKRESRSTWTVEQAQPLTNHKRLQVGKLPIAIANVTPHVLLLPRFLIFDVNQCEFLKHPPVLNPDEAHGAPEAEEAHEIRARLPQSTQGPATMQLA